MVDKLAYLIDVHLDDLKSPHTNWCLRLSDTAGRGVFATRDIAAGEVIFRERPLLIGPTARKTTALHTCTVCYRLLDEADFLCRKGCTLPVCDACAESEQHCGECDLFRSWMPLATDCVNPVTLRVLTIARGLFLNQNLKDLIYNLQANVEKSDRNEIRNVARFFDNFPTDERTLEYLYHIVAVLNTNAFEALSSQGNHEILLRGLYPLSGIMNHECTPNTCHYFDAGNVMVVKATRSIPKEAEITTTYTKILWSNLMRKFFLKITKQFVCECDRCQDPTEKGNNLAALICRENGCTSGLVIPVDNLSLQPKWRCNKCQTIFEYSKMSKYQEFALNAINMKMKCSTITELIAFINDLCPKLVPASNYIIIEAKLDVIWRMQKNRETYTQDDVENKLRYCKEILNVLHKLNAGECTLKRLLLEEIDESILK